jgi:predicted lipoprotein with Yx(FWY)xxD motif
MMKTLFRKPVRRGAGAAVVVALVLGLASAVALQSSSAANAATSSCADPTAAAPTGPATVSQASTAYGKVLVIGSGAYEGCSLYLLTSDQLHAVAGAHFACGNAQNAIGQPCDTVLWPALLTKGAPIAGRGVNSRLLGTVTRRDLPGLLAVQQVTYAGMPLYRFFLDEEPGETEGANLFDPVTSPTGIWYLVDPARGNPAPGTARLQLETAPSGSTGATSTVLAARMNNDFSLFPAASFPVYTPSHGGDRSEHGIPRACRTLCAQFWPPVLTSGTPEAGPGVDQRAIGTVARPDGTRQVTYRGRPLFLFADDAFIPGLPYNGGTASINGAGADTVWGMFDTIPSSS